jgi:NAD(P)-dependent dehydrogenase (short-subunit alcohol dehydrogenase family)
MKLSNEISAIITGGVSGMGAACAKALSDKGVNVVLFDVTEGCEFAKSINGHAIVCDVADAKSVESAFRQAQDVMNDLRIVINCAGIAPAKRMVGKQGPMALDDFKRVIDINLCGTFNVMRLASAQMVNAKPLENGERGVIINTASIAAFEGQIGQMAYSASKAGIVGLTLPAAREMATFGLRVNTIAPGLIATPLLLNMPQEVQDSLAATVPFPKRLGKPCEFASLACHIIENEMINGEVIRLDGALRMQAK